MSDKSGEEIALFFIFSKLSDHLYATGGIEECRLLLLLLNSREMFIHLIEHHHLQHSPGRVHEALIDRDLIYYLSGHILLCYRERLPFIQAGLCPSTGPYASKDSFEQGIVLQGNLEAINRFGNFGCGQTLDLDIAALWLKGILLTKNNYPQRRCINNLSAHALAIVCLT